MATQTERLSHAHPRGIKRPHDDELHNTQRLTKRFHLLNLENQHNGKLWVPSPSHAEPQPQPPSHCIGQSSTSSRPSQSTTDLMSVDDTKDRIYINDLDAELASVSDDGDKERMVFLPDIERRLNKIPHGVLAGDRTEPPADQRMVLYSVPHSLSVPTEQDSVRKAILDARTRAREQQQERDVTPKPDAVHHDRASIHTHDLTHHNPTEQYEDPDAMDIG